MELSRKFSKRRYFKSTIVSFLTCCMFFSTSLSVVLAGPEGAQVVNGQVSFQQSGYNTTITASDKSIINYSSFDIARPEIVQFIQPGSSASVLNRILSANPTNINGTLLANGSVFFVNPAGVYFGAGARVNVNQLVASGLNITNSDFINGRYNFAGGNGSVINSGDISAEKVYLIGRQVANSGSISCPAGYVVMASGDRVFLGEPGTDVVLEVDAPSAPESAETIEGSGVLNEGTVDAAGGKIVLAAGDIYSQAISNTGSLSASVETGEAGQVKLTAAEGTVINSGSIEAKSDSGTGGTVQVLGDRVGLFDAAKIDASGSNGGGTVLIGGDFQGKGDVPTASRTYVSSDSVIKADATENGDGGKVIVWADEITRFYGDISARGGAEGGDGGFVETSGKYLEVGNTPDTSSLNGIGGTWLIDPEDIEITNAQANITQGGAGDPGPITFDPTAIDTVTTIDVANINTALNNGSNVEVDTASGGTTTTGTITVSSPISKTLDGGNADGSTLTLTANDDIVVNAPISSTTGTLGVVLDATNDIDINAAITTNGGSFTSSGVDFDNTGGNISAGSGAIAINHTGTVTLGAGLDTSGTMSGTSTSIAVASNLASIKDAIDIASSISSSTINVDPGIYNEGQFDIDKPMTLQSTAGAGSTTVKVDDYGICIIADDVTVDDFTITTDATDAVGLLRVGMSTTNTTHVVDSVTISNNTFKDFSTNHSLEHHHGVAVGPLAVTNVDIIDNTFQNLTSTGTGAGAGMSGIVVFMNPGTPPQGVTITGNTLDNITQASGIFVDAAISIQGGATGTDNGIYIHDNTISNVSGATLPCGIVIHTPSTNVQNTNNEIYNVGYAGILIGEPVTSISITGDSIHDNSVGVHLLGSADEVVVNYNSIYNNGTGVINGDTTNPLNAMRNWWGDATGPLEIDEPGSEENPHGASALGDAVSDYVNFIPWYATDTTTSSTENVTVDHPTSSIIAVSDSIQGGIDAAVDGGTDTVQIAAGTYSEDVTVDKSLTLTVPSGTATMTTLSSDASKTTGLSGLFAANGSTDPVFHFQGAVTLAGHTSLSTGTGAGNIDFQSTLDGSNDFAENLTLTAGTGNISFGDDGTDFVGKTRALGDVLINSAADVTAEAAFTAKSLEQDIGTGTTWFKSTITTKGAGNQPGDKVDIQIAGDIQIDDKVDATGGAAASPGQNGGNVTLSGDTVTVDEIDTSGSDAVEEGGSDNGGNAGTIDITADTKIILNGDLTAAGGAGESGGSQGAGNNITLHSPTELAADVMISTGATAGNIDFSDVVNGSAAGNESLSLTAGTGAVTLQAVGKGTALEALSITTSGLTTLNGGIDTDDNAGTGNVDLSAATGGVTLGADVTIDTDDADDNSGGLVDLSGSAVDGAFDLAIDTGDDTVTLAAVGTTTALGSLTVATTGGLTTLGGSIKTDDHLGADTAAVDLSAATGGIKISTDVVINTDDTGDSSGGLVNLSGSAVVSTTDATEGLTIGAADGAVTLAGVGTTSALEYLSVTGGSASLGGNITTDNSSGTGSVTIATTGNTVLTSTVTIDTDDAGLGAADNSGGSIDLSGTSILPTTASTEQLILNSPGGTISLGNAGSETLEMGALTFSSGFGTLNLGGSIYTDVGFDATNATTVVLTGDSVIETDNDGSAINFTGTPINGTTAGTEFLTLNSGVGAVTLDLVGKGTALEALSITTSGPTTLNGSIDTDDNAGTGNVDLSAATGGIKITTDVAINTDDAGDASGGLIHFGSALDGTADFAENLTLTAGSGDIYFDDVVGGIRDLGDVTVNSADNVYIKAAFNANNIVITASDSTIDIDDNVTAAANIELNNNTTVADGKTLKAGNNLKMGTNKILTGEGDLTLIATAGGITEVGGGAVDLTMSNNDKTLRLTQNDALNMVTNFTVTNDENTDLIAEITGGTFSNTNADQWKSNQVKASGNITLAGSEAARDIVIGTAAWTDSGSNALQGVVNSTGGGVSIISNSRGIYDADSYNYTTKVGTSLDNVTITGTSNGTTGVPLPAGSGKAAIVIKSKEDLKLGLNCILTANGKYSTPDERDHVVFKSSGADSGDPIDVAIYLASNYESTGHGNIEVGSETVLIDNGPAGTEIGTLVVDAFDTVTFTPAFENSLKASGSSDIKRIEVVSRYSQTLEMARDRLPHADNPDNLADGEFVISGGVYALRGTPDGKLLSLAQILKLTQPVPLVVPMPLAPEDQGQVEVERRDAEVLGLPDRPELARAYPPSLNTDLNLDKAAQILYALVPILRDNDRIATLDRIVVEIWQDADQPIAPEQEAMIAQRIGESTAGPWIAALTEYVNVLSTMVGRPETESVIWVMQTYVIPQAEQGLIQDQTVAFVEMQIEGLGG